MAAPTPALTPEQKRTLAWQKLPCRTVGCSQPAGRRCVNLVTRQRTSPHPTRMSDIGIWLSRQPEIDSLQANLNTLNSALSTANGKVTTLTNNLNDAEDEIASLQAEILRLKNPGPVATLKTLYGAGGGNTDRTKDGIKVDRRYYGAGDQAKAVADVKKNAAAGILTWASFKAPNNWVDMTAGKGDVWFDNLMNALVATGVEVWVSIHHEPEGDGDEDDWRTMQFRLSMRVPGLTKGKIKFWLTTTGWNQEFNKNAVADEVDWETNLYPWGAPIYGIAYDAPYQTYGNQTKDGKTTFDNAWTDPYTYVDKLADRAASISAKEGRTGADALKAAIGEMGYGNEAFDKDKTWLEKVWQRAKDRGLLAVCYFDTTLNSSHSWTLGVVGGAKRVYFNGLLAKFNA